MSTTRTASFSYDTNTGLMVQEVIEPGTPAYRLETDHIRDSFGNKTATSLVGVDISTRTSTMTYDANGQFVTSGANALGQSETWQFDPRFGKPSSHTGPNGLTTTWTYDSLGRKIRELRADATSSNWSYPFCSGHNGGTQTCPSGAVYAIKMIPRASDGTTQNAPSTIVYYDSLDREVARDTDGFDGSAIRVSFHYNSLRRLQQQSRPYFAAIGTPQWTSFSYDALGRTTSETRPDGGVVMRAFHGLTQVDTDPLTRTTTTVRNSQNQIVSVTDALSNTTSYSYEPFGALVEVVDPAGNIVFNTIDVRGRTTAKHDPDLGYWTFAYNTVDELTSQTDAKGQTSNSSYDVLGRLIQRVEPDMTSVWQYDAAAHGVGKLNLEQVISGPSAGFQRSYTYESLGRANGVTTTFNYTDPISPSYTIAAAYDGSSRLSQVSYPSGFVLAYGYTGLGYLRQLANAGNGQPYWTADALDAEQHIVQETAGNGFVTVRGYDQLTGRLLSIVGGSNPVGQSLSYTYDLMGNSLTRVDSSNSVAESFTYDALNRLTSATAALSPVPLVKTFTYDAVGNMLTKSDVGTYSYPSPGAGRPHAVTSITGAITGTLTYDLNGNQVSGLGRSVGYTSYNRVSSITQGTTTLSFKYDPDYERFRQVAAEGTTSYFSGFGVHAEQFASATTQWREYIAVGERTVAIRLSPGDGSVKTRYVGSDGLNSLTVLTDETGAVVERDAYDAWGKRRFPNGSDDPTGSIVSQATRGFTNQEELAGVGLVHMNARVYDPKIARFTSVDPVVSNSYDVQSFNGYVYASNNPLVFVDPSGEFGVCVQMCGLEGESSAGSGSEGSRGTSSSSTQLPPIEVTAPTSRNSNTTVPSAVSELGRANSVGGHDPFRDQGSQALHGTGHSSISTGMQSGVAQLPPVTITAPTNRHIRGGHSPGSGQGSNQGPSQGPSDYQQAVRCMGQCHGFDPGYPAPMAPEEEFWLDVISMAATLPVPGAGQMRAIPGAVKITKYQIGLYDALKSRSVVGDGLDIHHAMQKAPAARTIAGYNPAKGPSIVLPIQEHRRIPTIKGNYSGSARDLLAKDIANLRTHTGAPNSSLRELIQLNKKMFPDAFVK
jgi:RHS repeat-associated protein